VESIVTQPRAGETSNVGTNRGPAPDPSTWRRVVARWPIPRRERWGRPANDLAEAGLAWPEDEAEAFRIVSAEIGGRP